VTLLRTAKISVEAFALLIRPGDPYVLIGDTIYPLSESEFYSLRTPQETAVITSKAFEYVLGIDDLSFMSKQDAEYVHMLKDKVKTCSSCAYRRYKDEAAKLIKKYGIKLPSDVLYKRTEEEWRLKEYPETSEPISPVAFILDDHKYSVYTEERRSCIDCVEKHLAQAYVLGRECSLGYPEHIIFVVGHLGEALDELPKEEQALKQALEFCMAKTNYTRQPFIPIGLLTPLIADYRRRHALQESTADVKDAVDNRLDDMSLDLSPDMLEELRVTVLGMDEQKLSRVIRDCRYIDHVADKAEAGNQEQIGWLGGMASMADELSVLAPNTANMLRNRRLMFSAAPALAKESGYVMEDIAEIFRKRLEWLQDQRH